mmetsp:Transcript_36610/g.91195  ORF Transcript_36610/g.91195 Transcript_36610/m.91195 type:complete len:204 (+) Transcript_36610:838-1449(+)
MLSEVPARRATWRQERVSPTFILLSLWFIQNSRLPLTARPSFTLFLIIVSFAGLFRNSDLSRCWTKRARVSRLAAKNSCSSFVPLRCSLTTSANFSGVVLHGSCVIHSRGILQPTVADELGAPVAWPVMATMGTESRCASASPVTRLVAPGPDVAMHTATRPVHLAYPSAANTSPCSWRHSTLRTPVTDLVRDWWISIEAPPG